MKIYFLRKKKRSKFTHFRIRTYFTQYFYRPVREDLSAAEQPTDRQEEDARQEADPEPRLQRVLRLRPAQDGGRAEERPAGVYAPRLGQGD